MKEYLKKTNYKHLFIIGTIYCLTFQNFLQKIIPAFRYFDELLALIGVFALILSVVLKKNNTKYTGIFLSFGIITIIGLLSNIIYKYQGISCIIGDIIVFTKFIFVVYLTSCILNKQQLIDYKENILKHINSISWIFVLFTLINYIFKYNPSTIRMGIMSNQIFFEHPTYLAAATIFLISFRIILQNNKYDVLQILLILVLISTMRFKAIGAAFATLIISIYIDKKNKKLSIFKIGIIGIIMIVLSFNHIKYYLLNSEYARNALTITSIEIAKEHFPFGTGFASYASYFSTRNYSPVYYKYELNKIYGLQNGSSNFATDVFWPMILGQFGIFGLIIYIYIVIKLFKNIQDEYTKENKYIYIAKIIVFTYLLVSSTSESAFTNPISIPLALIIGISTNDDLLYNNKTISKLLKYIKNPKKLIIKILTLNIIKISDKKYLQTIYKLTFGRNLNLETPKTFNEKLQWLKLYDRNPIYTQMVDKYNSKQYVKQIIGDKYIIPTIGIYNNFEDIKFKELPNKFVMKCTHDSGGIIICRDKEHFNIKDARKKIKKWLKTNYYNKWREWPYKNVKPQIIIEKFIGDNLLDYKIQCFNGEPDNILICEGRESKRGVRYHYFSTKWQYLNYCTYPDIDKKKFTIAKPENFDDMLKIAEKISKGFPQMRIDLYNVNNTIYFGEITLFSDAGFDTTITKEADNKLGRKLKLPTDKKRKV